MDSFRSEARAHDRNNIPEPATVKAAQVRPSSALLYDRVGGEAGLRNLVEAFYDIIEFEPEGRGLHLLHMRGHGVAHSRIEQLNFLSGFLGGPRLYVEKYGHSDVRDMHVHVEIDAEARDAWLKCMSIAIDRVGLPADVKRDLMANFTRVAFLLKNKD